MHWNPRHEAERHDDLDIIIAALPPSTGGGLYFRVDSTTAVIAVDPKLADAERVDALAHELVHHERGGGAHGRGHRRFRPDRIREERRVWRIVAARRVPLDRLAAFCDAQADLGHGVGPEEVQAEFDVSRRVAEEALQALKEHERGTR